MPQGLAERLAAEGRETEERARAAEAEAAGQLFAMRRELDDAVGWREEAEARAAAAEDAESEALNRAAEMEDEVARSARPWVKELSLGSDTLVSRPGPREYPGCHLSVEAGRAQYGVA